MWFQLKKSLIGKRKKNSIPKFTENSSWFSRENCIIVNLRWEKKDKDMSPPSIRFSENPRSNGTYKCDWIYKYDETKTQSN